MESGPGLGQELPKISEGNSKAVVVEVVGRKRLAEILGESVVKRFLGWLDLAGSIARAKTRPLALPYRETPSGLVWLKQTREGEFEIPLPNFAARIVAEVQHDDGAEVRRAFEIEATLHDRKQAFSVPSAEFAGMNWVSQRLGACGIVFPGFGLKDHARAAVQLLSGEVPRRTVLGHWGWRKIENEWIYLHAAGAIGANGPVDRVEVYLPDALKNFALPDPPHDPKTAIRSSLGILGIAPDRVTIPIFAAIWRAVLGSADFSLHLVGPTGAGKTELSVWAQQHFGPSFDPRNLAGTWGSTGNTIEALAFYAKDALLLIDDFAPTGGMTDVQRFHREADRVLRAQGNNAGRGRMRADGSLKPPKPPRGLIVSTGEDVPRGQSLRARLLVLEIGPKDIDFQQLTLCQADASSGLYAQALAGFAKWLAPHYEDMGQNLRRKLVQLREQGAGNASHRRTPEIAATLGFGFETFWSTPAAWEPLHRLRQAT